TACVSAATVLLVLLLSFLIYQWITIGVKNRRIEQLEQEIADIEKTLQENTEEALWYEEGPGKAWAAIELGYIVPESGD
ncbi:MAG: hypothetical protein IJ284_02725, partial [Clostridia bacterium]|nr:hypothetical protein [Clostridia bacterium]